MKPLLHTALCLLLLGMVGFLSCEKDGPDARYNPQNNQLPFASAGIDSIIILPRDHVTLDGTASTDRDGFISGYLWSKVEGPASFQIENPTASRTGVRSLVRGVYQFELQVTDNKGGRSKDTVQVTVKDHHDANHPPVANAGEDQTITQPSNSCTLNGSASYDPDGSITAYQWSKVDGPSAVSIQNPLGVQTVASGLTEGAYRFELKVTDNLGLTMKDTVQVTVRPADIAGCDIKGRLVVTARLTEIGTLSMAGTPSVAAAGGKIVFAGSGDFNSSGSSVSAVVDIYDISSNTWTKANLSKARFAPAIVSCGDKIFFAGGSDEGAISDIVDIYDASNGTWTVTHLSEPRTEMAAAAVGRTVLFAGGITEDFWSQSFRVDIYDTASKTWSRAYLNNAKFSPTAVTAGNKVYFAGGWDYYGNNGAYKDIDIYDNESQSWSRSSFAEIRGGVSGVALGEHIYWGGIGSGGIGKAEIWSIANGASSISCLSYPRYSPTAVASNNDIVFFTPGFTFMDQKTFSEKFDIYNVQTGKWSIGLLPQPMFGVAIINVNNTIYIAGGQTGNRTYTNKVYKLSW